MESTDFSSEQDYSGSDLSSFGSYSSDALSQVSRASASPCSTHALPIRHPQSADCINGNSSSPQSSDSSSSSHSPSLPHSTAVPDTSRVEKPPLRSPTRVQSIPPSPLPLPSSTIPSNSLQRGQKLSTTLALNAIEYTPFTWDDVVRRIGFAPVFFYYYSFIFFF